MNETQRAIRVAFEVFARNAQRKLRADLKRVGGEFSSEGRRLVAECQREIDAARAERDQALASLEPSPARSVETAPPPAPTPDQVRDLHERCRARLVALKRAYQPLFDAALPTFGESRAEMLASWRAERDEAINVRDQRIAELGEQAQHVLRASTHPDEIGRAKATLAVIHELQQRPAA